MRCGTRWNLDRWVLFAVLVVVGGCEGAQKREARALVFHADRFRLATEADRPERLRELLAMPCSDSEVCEVKSRCEASFAPTVKAGEAKSRVEREMKELDRGTFDAGDPRAKKLPFVLDEAEKALHEAKAKLPACEEGLTGLRVKYRL